MELSIKAYSLTCDFLLCIVIVAGRQKMAEDERGNVHLFFLMFHHWNTLPIVPDLDLARLPGQPHSNEEFKTVRRFGNFFGNF